MGVEISEEPLSTLFEYGSISIAFLVTRVLEVDLAGGLFRETSVERPWSKNYDMTPGHSPAEWRFDEASLIVARSNGRRVGGAFVVKQQHAILWDIRVDPLVRGQGIGRLLFRRAEEWAVVRGCHRLEVETQNINVDACRFYQRQGCRLGSVNPFAYPELPGEVQLIWHKDLMPPTSSSHNHSAGETPAKSE